MSANATGTAPGLPPFYCPIRSVIHPAAERITRQAVAWLDGSGLCTDEVERAWIVASHAAEFSCRAAPDADEPTLLLFSCWNHLMLLLDDSRLDRAPADTRAGDTVDFAFRLLRCLEAPESGLLGTGPVAAALAGLVTRTRAATSPAQFQRFVDGVRDTLWGAAWLNDRTERRIVPPLAEYIPARIADNGVRYLAAWLEIVNGLELPDGQLYSGPVRAVTEAASFVLACDNDLISAAKENARGDAGLTLVNVLRRHHGCAPERALAAALAIRDRVMTLFLRLRAQLAAGADAALRRYLADLGHCVAGNIHWSGTAPRYASPRGRYRLPVAGATLDVRWRDTPVDGTGAPLRIPTIAHWWDQLADGAAVV